MSTTPAVTDPAVRARLGALSGWVGIGANVLLCLVKLGAALLCGSVSIMADALNNLSDATGSIVTLIGFKLADKPADQRHPFGHARMEYLSGLAVSALILLIGFELGKTSLGKILQPEKVTFTLLSGLILVFSICVKLGLYLFNTRLGRRIGSGTLLATAADSRNDCVATAAVLLAGIIEAVTSWQVDGWMGLAVAVFIFYSGVRLALDTISPLLGENASPELRQKILDYISRQPKVLGYHDLMVHDYGPGQRFASLHVEMDRSEDPLLCHELIDDMERECLRSHGIHLVIHYDPVVTDDPFLDEMREHTLTSLRRVDREITIHDFRMVPGEGHTNLIFDAAIPTALLGRENEIRTRLEEDLNSLNKGRFYTVITFDFAEFNG